MDTTTTTTSDLFIKMVIAEWNKQNKNFEKLVDALGPDQLAKEVSPGKNTGVYLVGHLIAINDAMLPLLGFGNKIFPELDKIFISSPDQKDGNGPSIEELKSQLRKVNEELTRHIESATKDEWFGRHNAVGEADFAKEPHRNKLNVIINRSNHMSYHLGQLALLKTAE